MQFNSTNLYCQLIMCRLYLSRNVAVVGSSSGIHIWGPFIYMLFSFRRPQEITAHRQLVKAMPSLIFTKVQEDNCTSSMCAICLEDYNVGEKLRVLPCRHSMFVSLLTPYFFFVILCYYNSMTGTHPTDLLYCTLQSSLF